jgi:hypothetical protein
MDKAIYNTQYVYTIYDKEIEISPLKIKYMREFMECFKTIHEVNSRSEAVDIIAKCVQISMKQFCPEISKSVEDIEDNFDLQTLYNILEYAGGIKFNKEENDEESNNPQDAKNTSSWEDFT